MKTKSFKSLEKLSSYLTNQQIEKRIEKNPRLKNALGKNDLYNFFTTNKNKRTQDTFIKYLYEYDSSKNLFKNKNFIKKIKKLKEAEEAEEAKTIDLLKTWFKKRSEEEKEYLIKSFGKDITVEWGNKVCDMLEGIVEAEKKEAEKARKKAKKAKTKLNKQPNKTRKPNSKTGTRVREKRPNSQRARTGTIVKGKRPNPQRAKTGTWANRVNRTGQKIKKSNSSRWR